MSALRRSRFGLLGVGNHLDGLSAAAPSARDQLDRLGQHLLLLDRQISAHGEVMERPGAPCRGDIESGQVAARPTAIAERGHGTPYPGGRVSAPRTGVRSNVAGMVHAFVLIGAEPHRVADLAVELADVDGVAEVYSVAGEADLVAIIRVRQHDELAEIVTRRISSLAGIVETRTLIAFQAFSRHDLEAMWDLGA
jgi:DNA-binding Lrp family transcriptional regulator